MSDTIKRKCAHCKGEIEIDVDDIRDVVYFDDAYYHKTCFEQVALQKASNKRCSSKWQEALDDGLLQVQKDAKRIVNYCYGRDRLFEHLLNNYDICALSSYITMTLDNVVRGKYKGKSKPIPYRDFAQCWVDGQRTLNNIYAKNCQLGKSMSGDRRIIYDIAIVVGEYPKWKQRRLKAEDVKKEVIREAQFDDVDMSKIVQVKPTTRKDISNISDDIFVE